MNKNKLNGSLAYLSGGMDDAKDFGIQWRDDISPFLRSLGIGILNPTDKPCLLGKESPTIRDDIHRLKKLGKFNEVKEIMKPIVAFDLRMVDMCSFIILNINPDIHLCGSYIECAYAAQQQKPLLVICESGIERIPNWMFGTIDSETMFNSIESACQYLEDIDKERRVPSYKKWKFFDFRKIFS